MNLSRIEYEIQHIEQKDFTKLLFRCAGLPPKKSRKTLTISNNQKISQIKVLIKKAYGINPLIEIRLLYSGEFLPDNLMVGENSFSPFREEIIIMAVVYGA